MTEPDNRNRKETRKKNLFNKQKKSFDISEDQKFASKAKKAFKQKKQSINEEEDWEDWKNQY